MRNKLSMFFASIFAALLFIIAGTSAEEQSVPEEITLDQDVYETNRKGPVVFSHMSHNEDYMVSCEECHHVYKDGKNVWEEGDPVEKCASCHSPVENKGNVKKLSIAFHKNCKGCHVKAIREGISEEAPRKCYDCHERKP